MNLDFSERGWDDYVFWQRTDPRILRKINELLRDCRRSPFSGLGKPEQLRDEFSGYWSRRITDEHRLVYRVDGDRIVIAQCRFHYHK